MGDLYGALNDGDISCACETWSTKADLQVSLPNFNSIVSPAVKENFFGRAKGGLLLAFNSGIYDVENLSINNNYIFVKVRSNFICTVVGLIYVPSNVEMSIFLDDIDLTLNNVCKKYPGIPLVVGVILMLEYLI